MNNKKYFSKLIVLCLITVILMLPSFKVLAYTKDETVYSKVNSEGNVYETIVTDHLKNQANLDIINDVSELMNLKNINGEEKFSQEDNKLIWKAKGNDIYYQGSSDKQLPIDCKIRYELDGREISSTELAGKSGNVKITIEYVNKSVYVVTIDGKEETLYTPFVIMAGTVVDNTKVKNITVTNGKTIDNGKNTLIAAIACPGIISSLGIENVNPGDMNQIQMKFDVTDFEMNSIYSYITPKILTSEDITKLDQLDGIYSEIKMLEDSSTQLVKGANTLREGTNNYLEKSKEFGNAIATFSSGMATANNSYIQMDSGISTINGKMKELQSGVSQVNRGINQLDNGLNNLKSGVETGKEVIISELEKNVQSLAEGVDQSIVGKDKEVEVMKEQVIENENSLLKEELKQGISNNILKEVKSDVEKSLESILSDKTLGLSDEQRQSIMSSMEKKWSCSTIESKINTVIDNKVNGTIKQEKEKLDAINNDKSGVKNGLKSLKNQASQSMSTGIKKIELGFDSISGGVEELEKGAEKLQVGSLNLKEGTEQLSLGSETLKRGSTQLKTGINTLSLSSSKLDVANSQLIEGASAIVEGTNTLTEGIQIFDKEGIQKVVTYINGNIKGVQTRLKKLQELADEYNNFSGIGEGEGSVRLILILDSISKDTKENFNVPPVVNNTEEKKEEITNSSK